MVGLSSGEFFEEVLCVLAVRVAPQKTVEEVKTHVRRFAPDGWPSYHSLDGLHRGTQRNGCLFKVRSVWGAEMHAPIEFKVILISQGYLLNIISTGSWGSEIVLFLQGFLCVFPPNVEKVAHFPGGEKHVKSRHVSGCHGFSGSE